MADTPQGTSISWQLSRRLLPLAVCIGLLLSILAPITYWCIEHHNLRHITTLYAEALAGEVRTFVLQTPTLWKYQPYLFLDTVEGFHPLTELTGFRVLDENGAPIAGYEYNGGGIRHTGELSIAQELRYTRGTAPILFNNRQVGTVEVTASDGYLLRATALLFGFSAIVGSGLAILVYRFPVRVVGRLEESLRRATEFSRTVMDSTSDAVSIVDADTFRILGGNAMFLRQVGLSEAQVVGKACYELTHRRSEPCAPPSNPCPLRETVASGQHSTAEHRHFLESGEPVHFEVSTSPIFDASGKVARVVHVARDISARKRTEAVLAAQARELEQLALIDELTGLCNRRGFFTLAAQQLKTADRFAKRMYFLFADLDDMKWINDNLGHHVGDQALRETAELFRETFRVSDIIARFGGDEFAVLAMEGNEDGEKAIAKRFAEKLAAHNSREGRNYRLSVSIGVTIYDPSAPCSIEELQRRGDALMYAQKREMKRARQ